MTSPSPTTAAPHTLRSAIATRRMNRRAWIVTGMLVVFQVINFADKAVIGLVADPAMRELHLSASEYGFIGSSFFFLFAVSSIVVGFVAGKVSTQHILLTMGLAWAVVMFPILLGAGAAVLLVSRILLGAAEGPATPISLQHVHAWFTPRDRGLPSNMVAIGSTLGPVLAAPALAWVIAHPAFGWRWAFGLLGIIALLWSLAWKFVGQDGPFGHRTDNVGGEVVRPPQTTTPAQNTSTHPQEVPVQVTDPQADSVVGRSDTLTVVSMRAMLRTPMFVVAVLTGAGCFWAMGYLTTWAPKYLQAVVHISPVKVSLVFTLPWIVGAVALLGLGYLSRRMMRAGMTVRWSIGATYSAALVISGICFLTLPHVTGATSVIFLIFAAGLAMIYPMAPTAVAFAVGPRQRGALMATVGGLASIGAVIAPYMVGVLMDRAGYRSGDVGDPAAMAGRLADGMNSGFWLIGIYLAIVGTAGILFLNPDRTASRLHRAVDDASTS